MPAIFNSKFDETPFFSLTAAAQNIGDFFSGGSPKKVSNREYKKYTGEKTAKKPAAGNVGGGTGSYDVYGGSYGSSAPAVNQADLAYLDDQESRLNRQKQSASKALSNGLLQLMDSYNQEKNKANTRQSQALQDFSLKREDTTRGKDKAINKVDTNARTLAEGLRRRIGLASGSNSSAYKFTAPQAVARQASGERGEVVENYGVNFRNLDLGEKRVKSEFEMLLQDLNAQRKQREGDFKSGILDRQNQIDNSLAEVARQRALAKGGGYDQVRSAMAPYTAAIDSRQDSIDSLFSKYRTPFNVKAVDTKTPELRQYLVDRAAIQADAQEGTDPNSPYGQLLKPDEDEEELLY